MKYIWLILGAMAIMFTIQVEARDSIYFSAFTGALMGIWMMWTASKLFNN